MVEDCNHHGPPDQQWPRRQSRKFLSLLHNPPFGLSNTPQEEAVSENLKNMLLVMSNGGYLAPPDEKPEQEELWNETWKRVNRFLPNFFAELFPEEAGKPKRSKEVPTREKAKEEEVEAEKHEGGEDEDEKDD
jgi:hypothetical protein